MATRSTTSNKMEYVRLGNSGLKVSKLILGCMTYGDPAWADWVLDSTTGIEHIGEAWKLGITTFDTADTYSNGKSEEILGEALRVHGIRREKVVILTKVFNGCFDQPGERFMGGAKAKDAAGYVNMHGLSRKHIFDSVQGSLKRLNVDYIDLLQCHRFDYDTPIEETMQALHDVVKLGWVRYLGMSSCWAYQFQAMQNYATTNRLTPFISRQNFHNLAYREEEREMFPTLKMFGVGCIPWSPLSRGFLTRPANEKTLRTESDGGYKGRNNDALEEINLRVQKVAKDKGVSMAQVALAWSLSNEVVTAPIVGTTKLENYTSSSVGHSRLRQFQRPTLIFHGWTDAIHIKLTAEEKKYLEEAYVPRVTVSART